MNFIFEVNEEMMIPAFDFVYQTIMAVEYQDEFKRDTHLTTKYFLKKCDFIEDYKSWCPVGSVQFVHEWLRINGVKIPRPINIPLQLFGFSSLLPTHCGEGKTFEYPFFQKSKSEIKHPLNGFNTGHTPPGEWQTTYWIDSGFESEHRFFVLNGRIIDYRCYAGEYDNIPVGLSRFANDCIRQWKTSIPAYTLDIGTYDGENWDVIEAHHFYSCGLYGATMWNHLPQMLSQWYTWWIRSGQYNQ